MQHKDDIILKKILSELDIALDMVKNIAFDEFDKNEILKRAVCMTVINVGELVKSLSDDLRKEYLYIPWKAIAGFRDIAAHKYQTLHMADVYQTVVEDFPSLKNELNKIVK